MHTRRHTSAMDSNIYRYIHNLTKPILHTHTYIKIYERTGVSEAARALLFPLKLQSVYMPILPARLIDFLYAPVPFVAGEIYYILSLYEECL